MKHAVMTQVWRALLVAAGVTGLVLGWGPRNDMLAPLVFFTDQSNIAVAAYFTFALLWAAAAALRPGIARGPAGRRPGPAREAGWLRGAVTLYIIITGLVYHVVLATDKNPLSLLTGRVDQPAGIATFLLHYTVPVMALTDFLLACRGGAYRWRYAAYWLCYPLAYLAFVLIRGAFFTVGSYPYPFVDVTAHGYAEVARNAVEYTVLFYLLGTGVIALARLVRRHRATAVTASAAGTSGGESA
jgi:hypothetical protein